MFTGHSFIDGAFISFGFSGVKFKVANLSMSFPERTPQKSVAYAKDSVVMFNTNSPYFLIMSYECLEGLIEIYGQSYLHRPLLHTRCCQGFVL